MQVLLNKNDFGTPYLRQTMETICHQAGFMFRWQDETAELLTESIWLRYLPPVEQSDKVFFIPALLNSATLNQPGQSIEQVEMGGRLLPVLNGTKINPGTNGFSLDLVANVYYHLNRIEERNFTHPDQVDPEGGYSSLRIGGNFFTPVVDLLIEYFAQWLQQQAQHLGTPLLRKASWPGGEPFALAMTHDVDFIRAFHPLKKIVYKLQAALDSGPFKSSKQIEAIDQAHWGFDTLLPFYKERNWPVTFLFIPRPWEGLHQRYNIRRRKLRRVIREIVAAGHELALHSSRFAFDHPLRYRHELLRLKLASRFKVRGMRHHYLRGLFPQLWEQAAKMGLVYDTTLCHRRKSGFRAGTAHPYRIQTPRGSLLEIPTIFFENTLPGEGSDVEASLKEMEVLLAAVKSVRGALTILWHTNNVAWPEHYRQLWQALLNILENEKPWRQRLDKMADWICQREAIQLKSMSQKDNICLLKFELPEPPERFTLYMPEELRFRLVKQASVHCRQGQTGLTMENPEGLQEIEIEVERV